MKFDCIVQTVGADWDALRDGSVVTAKLVHHEHGDDLGIVSPISLRLPSAVEGATDIRLGQKVTVEIKF